MSALSAISLKLFISLYCAPFASVCVAPAIPADIPPDKAPARKLIPAFPNLSSPVCSLADASLSPFSLLAKYSFITSDSRPFIRVSVRSFVSSVPNSSKPSCPICLRTFFAISFPVVPKPFFDSFKKPIVGAYSHAASAAPFATPLASIWFLVMLGFTESSRNS